MRIPRFLEKPSAHLALIALLGLLAYSNTFDVPFHFDDADYIVENPIVKDFDFSIDSSKGLKLAPDSNVPLTEKTRSIAFLTFFANYKIHGLEVWGYHAVNLAIHIINALLVYLLLMLTFKTPSLENSKGSSANIALISALLFVLHPVQTQAVTYISQRFTSLVALFYLGSLVFYIKWRLTRRGDPASNPSAPTLRYSHTPVLFYLLSLLFAVLAMKTKETAFTLPLAIALYEQIFFKASFKRRLFYLSPFILTMLIVPASLMHMDGSIGEAIGGATKTQELIPRWDYLLTQLRVIVTYLRLLIFPVNLNLDYDYPVFHSFFAPQVLASFLLLLSIFCLLAYLYLRSLKKVPALKLVVFGGLWFFLTLSVESSIISLADVIFEHRVYLPSIGAFTAVAAGGVLWLNKPGNGRLKPFAVLLGILLLLVFSYASHARNNVWRSGAALWEDVVSKSPGKARGHYNLGIEYSEKGMADRAMEQYRKAIEIRPNYADAHNNLGNAYAAMGFTDKAIEHLLIASKLRPNDAETRYNIGLAYYNKGFIDDAIEHGLLAVGLRPDFADAYNNLALSYESKGMVDQAIEHYMTAVKLNPSDSKTHYNLGLIYFKKGLHDNARTEFESAVQTTPPSIEAKRMLDYMNRTTKDSPLKR